MNDNSQGHTARNRPPGDEVERARLLTELGRYEQAERLLKRLLASRPDHLAARRQLAAIFLKAGRYEELLQLTEQLLAGSPEDGEFHYYRACALRELGNLEAAETALREALRLRPDDPRPHYMLVIALAEARRQQEVLEVAQEYARRWPDKMNTHLALMVGLSVMDRLDEAEESCLQGLTTDPGSVPARLCLALLRLQCGKPAEARADILAVLGATPDRKNLQLFEQAIRRVGRPSELADVYQMIQASLGQGASPEDKATGPIHSP